MYFEISHLPEKYVDCAISTLLDWFAIDDVDFHKKGDDPQCGTIYSNNIPEEDVKVATAICFGVYFGMRQSE